MDEPQWKRQKAKIQRQKFKTQKFKMQKKGGILPPFSNYTLIIYSALLICAYKIILFLTALTVGYILQERYRSLGISRETLLG